jgi:hypothetical protein
MKVANSQYCPDYQECVETICRLLACGPMRLCEMWRYFESCGYEMRISNNHRWTVLAKPLRDLEKAGCIMRLRRGLYALAPL